MVQSRSMQLTFRWDGRQVIIERTHSKALRRQRALSLTSSRQAGNKQNVVWVRSGLASGQNEVEAGARSSSRLSTEVQIEEF